MTRGRIVGIMRMIDDGDLDSKVVIAALDANGALTIYREERPLLMALLTDLRIAVRSLARARGLTATIILTLGLGVTVCTTTMAVVTGYLMTDLPYPAADRLYSIRYSAPGQPPPREMEQLDWSSLSDVIEHPIAWDLDMFYLLGGDHAEATPGAWVTPGFMRGLGIEPAVGTGLDSSAFAPGSSNVALISHRLWRSRFGGVSDIVGRSFSAYVSDRPDEAESFTIVGVLPAGFWHINPYTDVLAPLRAPTYPYMVRLREGVSPERVAGRITALVSAGARNVPPNWRVDVVSSHEGYVERLRPILRAVGGAAVLVLLVACGNIAALLLVRSTRREREVAIRAALGARRGAITRMLLAEGLVVGTAATALALVATWLTVSWLTPLVERQLGRPAPAQAITADARVLAIAVAIGLFTVLVCTLAPLVTSWRPRMLSAFQSGSRSVTEGRRSQRARSVLIALEVAASLTLLTGSTLMLRTIVTLVNIDLGFSAERVLQASITLRQNRYPDDASRIAVFERMTTRLKSIPGVESVGLTTAWLLQQQRPQAIEVAGASGDVSIRCAVTAVGESFNAALGIPIASGRGFKPSDRLGSEPVAMVSETLARRFWPGGNAIGARLRIPQAQERGEPVLVERLVIGVSRDVRQGPADEDLADVYVPMLQAPTRFTYVLMRTAGNPLDSLSAFRDAFKDIDPEIPVQTARPLQAIVDDLAMRPRFLASLLAAFAFIATTLALVGVYGVIAYAVRQREREIAVRLAIGANPANITRLFMRQGGVVIATGLAIGMLGALAGGRLIETQLFGISARDPLALALAIATFGLAGLAAVWWSSRRAAATDPAIALRSE